MMEAKDLGASDSQVVVADARARDSELVENVRHVRSFRDVAHCEERHTFLRPLQATDIRHSHVLGLRQSPLKNTSGSSSANCCRAALNRGVPPHGSRLLSATAKRASNQPHSTFKTLVELMRFAEHYVLL